MHFNVANRKVHFWTALAAGVPLLVIIASGILLQTKKQWDWVQPPEHRGTGTVPTVGFDQVLASLQGIPGLGVTGWDDVDRLDVRPGRGVVKITLRNRWEVQIDLGSGRVMQTAYRRSDLIETIHDGSFFAGDWTKLGLFLPAGLTLLLLWLSGVWMVWVQISGKRRRKALNQRKAAAVIVFTMGLPGLALARQPSSLQVDPLVGHWETTVEKGEAIVVADARKWRTEKAETPFPLAAVRGVNDFRDGVLSVKFKMIAGESDQIAGIAFGISPSAEYFYARYNTKDGNLAVWRFADGARKRILDGTEHRQLPLNAWHELRVEVRGPRIVVTVNGKLRTEGTLEGPVSGRVGFYTKRDSVSAFKDFTIH